MLGSVPELLVFCRSCGREVASSDVRAGLCLDCRVERELAGLREEHLRLWRKRERYAGHGANTQSIGRQLERVEERMAERVRTLVPDDRRAAELLTKELERARRSRYEIRRPSRLP
jgi:hypothetical protein